MQSSLVVCNDAVKSYGFRKVSAIFCTLDHDTLGVALPLSSTMTVESRPDFAANGCQTPMKIWLWYASAIDFGSFILISYEDGFHAKNPLLLVKFYSLRTRRGDIIKNIPAYAGTLRRLWMVFRSR